MAFGGADGCLSGALLGAAAWAAAAADAVAAFSASSLPTGSVSIWAAMRCSSAAAIVVVGSSCSMVRGEFLPQ